ncbi:MAG: glycosyltransferase family 4 protein [Patescibacteria group bacterium]|nr:glycosyltransferase family 4 protein [Patescibacteria group bacterium]
MKIGLISFHTFSQPGGVKRHILGLSKELKSKGHSTKIIVPRRKRSENYGKDVILLGTSIPMDFSGTQADFDINFNPISIERVLKREKFDVLHFHNFGFPSVLQILISPAASGTLNVLTFHANMEGSTFLKHFPSFLYLLNKICQWKIDGVIGVAPLILNYFKFYKGPKIVIPNGIDLNEFNPNVSKIEKYSDDKINLLFVGRIEERKGLIYLLKAFKILNKNFSNLRLIIVGDGPLENECKDYVKKHNLKEVIFEGRITKGIARYYKTADIYISPALFRESFGLVLLEAMACGTPVVAFGNQGYRELLKNKSSGRFLTKPRDYVNLAKKIELLIRYPDLRRKISERGIKEVEQYSWQSVTNEVLEFYKVCEKYRAEKKDNGFSLEKSFKNILTKDILKWVEKVIEED